GVEGDVDDGGVAGCGALCTCGQWKREDRQRQCARNNKRWSSSHGEPSIRRPDGKYKRMQLTVIRTPFTELVGVEQPVVCAGMGAGAANGELAGHVSEA